MPRFAIATYSDQSGVQLRLVESDTKEAALRVYFQKYVQDYTPNEEGFSYFRDDFNDPDRPLGSFLEV